MCIINNLQYMKIIIGVLFKYYTNNNKKQCIHTHRSPTQVKNEYKKK